MQDFDVGERDYLAQAKSEKGTAQWLAYNYFLNVFWWNCLWLFSLSSLKCDN
jgi:hypothetical protein